MQNLKFNSEVGYEKTTILHDESTGEIYTVVDCGRVFINDSIKYAITVEPILVNE